MNVGNVGRECWWRWPDKVKSVRRETGRDCNILRKYFNAENVTFDSGSQHAESDFKVSRTGVFLSEGF